jgi:hypothetical protein
MAHFNSCKICEDEFHSFRCRGCVDFSMIKVFFFRFPKENEDFIKYLYEDIKSGGEECLELKL